MRLIKALILVLVVLSLFGLKVFAQETKQEVKETGHEHTMGVEKRFVASVGSDGVQHVEIIGGEYYFDPNYIVVKVNTPVELKVKKTPGYVPHKSWSRHRKRALISRLNWERNGNP